MLLLFFAFFDHVFKTWHAQLFPWVSGPFWGRCLAQEVEAVRVYLLILPPLPKKMTDKKKETAEIISFLFSARVSVTYLTASMRPWGDSSSCTRIIYFKCIWLLPKKLFS